MKFGTVKIYMKDKAKNTKKELKKLWLNLGIWATTGVINIVL